MSPANLLRSEPGPEHLLVLPIWDDRPDPPDVAPWDDEHPDEIVGWERNASKVRNFVRHSYWKKPFSRS